MEVWESIVRARCWSSVGRGYLDHWGIVGLKRLIWLPKAWLNGLGSLISLVLIYLIQVRHFILSWKKGYPLIMWHLWNWFHGRLFSLHSYLRVADGMLSWMILWEIRAKAMLDNRHLQRHLSIMLLIDNCPSLVNFSKSRDIIRTCLLHILIIKWKNRTINIFISSLIYSLSLHISKVYRLYLKLLKRRYLFLSILQFRTSIWYFIQHFMFTFLKHFICLDVVD